MLDLITNISKTEDITLVTLNDFPAKIDEIANIFYSLKESSINVDMISHSVGLGGNISLSFSALDKDLGMIFMIVASLRTRFNDISCDVSASNTKFLFYGEKMKDAPGVASDVFNLLKEHNIDVKMITTSESEISILVDKAHADVLSGVLKV